MCDAAHSVLVDRVAAARDIEEFENEKRRQSSEEAFRKHASSRPQLQPAKKQATLDTFLGKRSAVS
jgi:hypothetical protein